MRERRPTADSTCRSGSIRCRPARVDRLRGADIVEIGTTIGAHILRDEITRQALEPLIRDALDFPVPLVQVTDRISVLELFHGPTMAFKDVGARVQARLLHHFTDGTPLTILVATSGDTGSAVAQAFHRVPDARVVVLYPEGQVSDVQEAQMASLGDNITALAVRGTFDDCQRLVKQAFADDDLRPHVWLTPANSINLGRLLPQVFYYFLLAGLGSGREQRADRLGAERQFRQPDGRAHRQAHRSAGRTVRGGDQRQRCRPRLSGVRASTSRVPRSPPSPTRWMSAPRAISSGCSRSTTATWLRCVATLPALRTRTPRSSKKSAECTGSTGICSIRTARLPGWR